MENEINKLCSTDNTTYTSNMIIYCPICFKNFNSEVKIITLNCGHYFCSNCLGQSNFHNFYKCCVCRSINTSYDSGSSKLMSLFNFVFNEKENLKEKVSESDLTISQINEIISTDKSLINKDRPKIFCKDCREFIDFENFHSKEFPIHTLVPQCEIQKFLKEDKNEILNLTNDFKKSNFISKLHSDFDYDKFNLSFRNSLNKNFKNISEKILENINIKNPSEKQISNLKYLDLSDNHLISCLDTETDQKSQFQNKKEIYNKLISFQKSLRRLKNKNIIKEVTQIFLKSHKNLKIKNLNRNEVNKYCISYIRNTKKVAIFNVDDLDVTIHEIQDLPFNFYKSSHSVDYNPETNKLYISGGKQENYNQSKMSKKIWEFSIHDEKLKLINNLEYEITGHRSIIIGKNGTSQEMFIIGGRKGEKKLNSNNEIFYDKIFKLDLNSYTIEINSNNLKLKYPRSNFGVAYENMQIFLCLGITTGGYFLNNIEILNLYSQNISSSIVEMNYLENSISKPLRLKDHGVIIDNENDNLLILGGQGDNLKENHKTFYFDVKDYKFMNYIESKEIISGSFTSYGTKYNAICAVFSNYTINDELPHIYLYSEMNKKWTCHSIDIYTN
jgi:hypothetical protein